MTRKYYTLAVLPNCEGRQWSPQFGDYDRAVVAQEQADTTKDWPKGSKFKIIRTDYGQRHVNAAIDKLNAELFGERKKGFTQEDLERHAKHNAKVADIARNKYGAGPD